MRLLVGGNVQRLATWALPATIVGGLFLASAVATYRFSLPGPAATQSAVVTTDWSNRFAPAHIGDKSCSDCHSQEMQKYRRSGHAQTFFTEELAERYAALLDKSFSDPLRNGTFTYVADGPTLVAVRQADGREERLAVDVALGSGNHATTFLTLLKNKDGSPGILEHRVSWFADGPRLGLTPSHSKLDVKQALEMLGRVHGGQGGVACIGCHTTTAQLRDGQLWDLRANVGCESCHGPGRKHAAAVSSGEGTGEIQFAPGSATAMEEIRMCGRCHRLPETVSPPSALDDPRLVRFQPVGILNSACFRRSEGQLRCTTCHDPHGAVVREPGYYNQRCRNCHSQPERGEAICRNVEQENCVQCHMPRVSIPPGIAFNDHWIRVRRTKSNASPSATEGGGDAH